jgi:transcriptional regulator with XRE-family HTH domain
MNKINYKAKFDRRLKILRKEKGLTQEELSEAISITELWCMNRLHSNLPSKFVIITL